MVQQIIERHGYTDFIVSLAVELYIHLRLGLRSTSALIAYLSARFGWGLEKTPCPNSIKNWVEKCGYEIYEEPAYKNSEDAYAQIIDESMLAGREKLLVTLGVKAEKGEESALNFEDIKILDMSVRPSWNAESVEKVIEQVRRNNNKSPEYVISDNAGILSKAVRAQSLIHLPDVGHTMALFVERAYKNDETFKSFCKEMADVKFREIMRCTAYLLPPKQRSVARFMNLSSSVKWAKCILHNFARLNEEEQKVFHFIHSHRTVIEELNTLFNGIDAISKDLKIKGLSFKSVENCLHKIAQLQQSSSAIKIKSVLGACSDYLNQMKAQLPDRDTVWHISSDIIESLFGYYKFRKTANPLNGVTTQIFILPLLTKINRMTGRAEFSVKTALENVFLSNLTLWRNEHLTENMAVARREMLAVA